MVYVTDTHSFVWYLTFNDKLSNKALKAFDSSMDSGIIVIPSIVLAEILYINKKGRIAITFDDTINAIINNKNYEICPLDLEILKIANKIEVSLEMHDKLIAATAILYNAHLISKDSAIRKSDVVKVIW